MSELKPCPFCGSPAYSYHDNCIDFAGVKCDLGGCVCADILITENNWNTRPIEDALNARIAELEGIIKSDDERLTEAGLKVNLYFGCDTAEIMAEEILSSRARIAELEGEVTRLLTERDDAIMAEARYIAEVELAKKDARIDDLEIEVKELRRGYSPSRKPEKNKVVLVDYKGTLYFGLFNDRGTWETAYRDNIRQYSGIRRWWELPEVQK